MQDLFIMFHLYCLWHDSKFHCTASATEHLCHVALHSDPNSRVQQTEQIARRLSNAPETLEVEYFQPLTNRVGFPSLTLPSGVAVEEAGQIWTDEADVILYRCSTEEFIFVSHFSVVKVADSLLQQDTVAGVPGEWLLPEDGDKDSLLLWAHGGGFMPLCLAKYDKLFWQALKSFGTLPEFWYGKWPPQGFVHLVHIGSFWRRHAVILVPCHSVLAQPELSNRR